MIRSHLAVALSTAAVAVVVHRHLAEKARMQYTRRHTEDMRELHHESFNAGWDANRQQCARYMSAREYELMTGEPHPYKS